MTLLCILLWVDWLVDILDLCCLNSTNAGNPWKFWLPLLMPYALLVWCLLISWSGCFDGVSVLREHESTLVFNDKTVFRVILYMRAGKKKFQNELQLWNILMNARRLCSELAGSFWVTLSTPLMAGNKGIASRFWVPSDSQFLQRTKTGETVRICSANIIVSGMGVGLCPILSKLGWYGEIYSLLKKIPMWMSLRQVLKVNLNHLAKVALSISP